MQTEKKSGTATDLPPFKARVELYLRLLDEAPLCNSQQSAHDQIQAIWVEANLRMGVPRERLKRLIAGTFSAEDGWEGIGSDVASWETMGDAPFRIFLHADGAIVIQYTPQNALKLIYSRPGARKR